MREAARKSWSETDHDYVASVTQKVLTDLGFDIAGWIAMADVPRNEPPEPKAAKESKQRSVALGRAPERQPRNGAPIQLNFAFA